MVPTRADQTNLHAWQTERETKSDSGPIVSFLFKCTVVVASMIEHVRRGFTNLDRWCTKG